MLRHLGADEGLVSEVRIAEAYKSALQIGPANRDRFATAAALVKELTQRKVVRDLVSEPSQNWETQTETELSKVAIFALMLWFLIEREGDHDNAEELLLTCCDVSKALESELADSCGDPERLRALFAAYVDKI